MNGVTPSPVVAEQALMLLEQNRLVLLRSGAYRAQGRTGAYAVTADSRGVWCSCQAGSNWDPASCSHKVAAQIAWAES